MTHNSELLKQITDAISMHIRPSLQMDGGDISIVSLDGNVLTVKLMGACYHCPRSSETLKFGVEKMLRQLVSSDIVVCSL